MIHIFSLEKNMFWLQLAKLRIWWSQRLLSFGIFERALRRQSAAAQLCLCAIYWFNSEPEPGAPELLRDRGVSALFPELFPPSKAKLLQKWWATVNFTEGASCPLCPPLPAPLTWADIWNRGADHSSESWTPDLSRLLELPSDFPQPSPLLQMNQAIDYTQSLKIGIKLQFS